MSEVLQVTALKGYPDEIGRWLWAMQALRHRTLKSIEDLDQATLDWEGPDGGDNAIGSLLYHIALTEMSWLYLDILQQEFPSEVKSDFPYDMVNPQGSLTRIRNVSLEVHIGRLERSRSIFLEAFRNITADDWRRLRSPEDVKYEVTPEWAVFHLVEHEAGHTFQISAIKQRANRKEFSDYI